MNNQKQLYTENKLNEYGIFQLREIARSVGVHLPTTFNKEDLIKKILQVVNGEIEPFVPKNKKGRPPKNFVGYESSWKKQELGEENTIKAVSSWEQGNWLKNNNAEVEQWASELKVCMDKEQNDLEINPNFNKGEATVEGVLFIEPNGWGTLHIGGMQKLLEGAVAIVAPKLVEYYNLQTGDYILGSFSECEQTKLLNNVILLNGKEPEKKKRTSFNDLTISASNNVIPLWQNKKLLWTKYLCPIGKGQRVLVRGEKGSGKTKLLKALSFSLDANNVHTIFVALNKRPEDKIDYSDSNVEYGFSSFDMIPFRQMYLMDLAIAHAKRLCEMGKDVALIVDDLWSVIQAYDYCLPKSNSDKENIFDVNSIVALKKLMAIGRNTEKGSITLIGCIGLGRSEEEKRLVYEIDDLCNSHIELNKQLFLGQFSCFVTPNSWTDNAYALSSKEDFNIGQSIRASAEGKNLVEISKIYEKYFP